MSILNRLDEAISLLEGQESVQTELLERGGIVFSKNDNGRFVDVVHPKDVDYYDKQIQTFIAEHEEDFAEVATAPIVTDGLPAEQVSEYTAYIEAKRAEYLAKLATVKSNFGIDAKRKSERAERRKKAKEDREKRNAN